MKRFWDRACDAPAPGRRTLDPGAPHGVPQPQKTFVPTHSSRADRPPSADSARKLSAPSTRPVDRDKRPALIYVRKSHTLFMALDTGRRNPDALDPGHFSTGPRAESLGGVERFDPLSETCDRPPSIGGRSSGKETRVHVCVNPKQFLPQLKALAPLCGPPLPKPDPRNRADAGHGGPAGSAPRFVLSFSQRRVPPSLPERALSLPAHADRAAGRDQRRAFRTPTGGSPRDRDPAGT